MHKPVLLHLRIGRDRSIIVSAALLALVIMIGTWLTKIEGDPIAPRSPSATNSMQSLSAQPQFAANLDDTIIQTYNRPLFSPSRRKALAPAEIAPPQIEEVAEVTPEPEFKEDVDVTERPEKPHWTLLGVQAKGTDRQALIFDAATARSVWLGPGGELDQWFVEQIGEDFVEFRFKMLDGPDSSDAMRLELYRE